MTGEDTAVQLPGQGSQKSGVLQGILFGFKPLIPRLLFLCAMLFPAIVFAQPAPGWYRNSGPATIYENSDIKIVWQDSYIYQHPGPVNLYWYAKVIYTYKGGATYKITCATGGLPPVTENMRGDPGDSGSVPAAETLCSRHPGTTVTLNPGESFNDWVIFHNVPSLGEVSLQWDPYGSSQWVNLWYIPYPDSFPQPDECPAELVSFQTCQPKADAPAIQPHPAAYEIAQKISRFLQSVSQISGPPASANDFIIGVICLSGTFAKGLPPQFQFEVKCVTSLQNISNTQCADGDYVCFSKYLLAHPNVLTDLLTQALN